MNKKNKKLKIAPIFPDNKYVKYMGEVTTVQSFDKGLITENGLYSEKIFGPVGSDTRMVKFGFIDLGIKIAHPLIWEAVTKKKLYKSIINGETYVVFDNEIKDFAISDAENGHTGYNYFFNNLPRVEFLDNGSMMTADNIALYNTYKDNIYYNKLLVLPAGLRDYSVGKDGRFVEMEINDFYSSIIGMSGLTKSLSDVNVEDLNDVRLRLQDKVNELYDYLMDMINGKHKFINDSFAATNIDYSTRNVASGLPLTIDSLRNVRGDINTAQIGLVQFVKSISPFIQYEWDNLINNNCFVLGQDALLVDKETHKNVHVSLGGKLLKKFSTPDGVENIMSNLVEDEFKNSPIEVGGYWLLTVLDTDNGIILYDKIDNSMEQEQLDKLRPITYGELFFILAYKYQKTIRGLITRHPIASELSVYPSKVLLNSTHTSVTKTVTIMTDGASTTAKMEEYPVIDTSWVPGLSPSSTRLPKLGLDYDGDKLVFVAMFTNETNNEIDRILNSLSMYIDSDGNEVHDINDNVCKRTFLTLTKV